MNSRVIRLILGFIIAAVPVFLAGCGSGSSASIPGSGTQDGSINLMVSDASTEDWSTIGVKILSISLIPQGGGNNVSVYSAAEGSAPMINLAQLDQLGEILGNVPVPVGTYTGAVVTISGNPTDIQLTSSADPSAAFLALGTAATSIPSSQIQVQGASGTPPTVTVTVNFVSNLIVTANSTNALDLEFDLSHPAFIVGHLGSGTTVWAINFNGPLRHHPIPDITRFVLRHIYGTVTAVSSSSLTITKDFPVEPVAATASAETAIASTHSIQILPDGVNGTIYYDVDAKAAGVVIYNFTTLTSTLTGKYVRVAARYQSDGTLVAVRLWASSSFGSLWVSPEGHVLHVNTTTNTITVENEIGAGVPLAVTASTQFFFRTPWNAVADAASICTGATCLTKLELERGFKVHASVVDPTVAPTALSAQTVDIEIARYDGVISIPAGSTTEFTYTRNFSTKADDYVVTLPYIFPTTANGSDPVTGTPITGFKWWDFTFPTIVDSDANDTPKIDTSVIADFISATDGTVSFGGTAPPVTASGESYAWWGDPANPNGWSVPWTVLDPTQIQLGTAKTGFSYSTGNNGSFTMQVPLGSQVTAVTVNMSVVSGSGTLVYQVARTGAVVTITPEDITTGNGRTAVTSTLVTGTPVNVYGVPQPDGTIKAYVVLYYTGTVTPTAVD